MSKIDEKWYIFKNVIYVVGFLVMVFVGVVLMEMLVEFINIVIFFYLMFFVLGIIKLWIMKGEL